MEDKSKINPDVPYPTDPSNVHILKIANEVIIEPSVNEEKYYHNAKNFLNNTNVDIHAGHVDTHGIQTKHLNANTIVTSSMTAGSLDIGEYKVNGKVLADKNKKVYASSIKLDNNVNLTTDSDENFILMA